MPKKYHLTEIFSPEQLETRIKELALQIQKDFAGQELIAVCLLNGAFIFFSDLVRNIHNENLKIDFLRVSSYGDNIESSLKLKVKKDLEFDVVDKNVLVVDDIIDTGFTLEKIVQMIKDKGAKTVKTCTLINKKERRLSSYQVDYYGFDLDKGYIVGYGLDMAQKLRNLNGIYEVCFE